MYNTGYRKVGGVCHLNVEYHTKPCACIGSCAPYKRGQKMRYSNEELLGHIHRGIETSSCLGNGHCKVWELKSEGIRNNMNNGGRCQENIFVERL